MRSFEGAVAHDHDSSGAWWVSAAANAAAAPSVGVRALMLAMLEDALRAYLGPVGPAQAEAARWIERLTQPRRVLASPWSAKRSGLEPSAVRIAMRRMHARCGHQAKMSLGRSRPSGSPTSRACAIERGRRHIRPPRLG